MSSLTLVLVGTGECDTGGFALQKQTLNDLDWYLDCSDLLDLWKKVEAETGITTQKPFLLIVDQDHASRLSKNKVAAEPLC